MTVVQRRNDELVEILRPDFVTNDGLATPSFLWACVADGTAVAPSFHFCADTDTGLYRPAANELGIATFGVRRGIWNATGALILNDAAASTFMTGPGVTIQQGALDDEAVAVQSSDVAHGMTAIADTDTYHRILKAEAAAGGVALDGFKDADGVAGAAAQLRGYLGEDANTTKTTAGRAIVEAIGYIRDAGTPTQVGNTNADGNVFGVRTRRGGVDVTLLLVDEDADLHVFNDIIVAGLVDGVDIAAHVATTTAPIHGSSVASAINTLLHRDATARAFADDFLASAGAVGTPAHTFVGDPDTGLYSFAANELGIATGGAHRAHWNTTGAVILNDAAVSTFMTGPGVTIQQGAFDDEAVAVKSTDVAHGITTFADTDTYFTIEKVESVAGGALVQGLKDADGVAGGALALDGLLGENVDTTKTTAGRAIVEVSGYIKSGTGVGNTNADGNVFAVRTGRGGVVVTLLLVDENGDCYELGDEYLTGSHRASVSVGVRVYRDAAFVHNNTGNFLPIDFNQQRWDDPDDDQWVIGTPTRLTCQFDGIYVITGHVYWAANATGIRGLHIFLNGATNLCGTTHINLNATGLNQSITTTYKLVVGDFVELRVYQNSGGNLNILSLAQDSPEFSMVRAA